MKDVDSLLSLHADHWDEKTQPQIDALEEASGNKDDTGLILKSVRQTLSDGGVVDPVTMETLRQRLGDWHEGDNLIGTLNLQNTHNRVKAVGNFRDGARSTDGTFGGGIGDTEIGRNLLSPFGGVGKYGPRAVLADIGLAHLAPSLSIDPTIAGAVGAAQVAGHLGVKTLDKVLRNSNPLQEFSRRFGMDEGAPENTNGKPSFVQQETVGQALSQDIADTAKRAVLTQRATRRQAEAEGQATEALAFAKARIKAKDTLDAQGDLTDAPSDQGLRHVRVGDQVVSFDPKSVGNPERYAASVARRMRDRMEVIADAKGVLPETYRAILDTLHTELTHNSSSSPEVAFDRVEDAVNKLPPEYQGAVLDKLNQAKLWASYTK